jgi:hypothetical protein
VDLHGPHARRLGTDVNRECARVATTRDEIKVLLISAAEIIEKFKTLPVNERAEVREFVSNFETNSDEGEKVGKRMTFEEAVDHVFEQHAPLLKRLAD